MIRLKLTLAYVGTRFSGWQIQEHPSGISPATVQGALEQAIARIAGRHVRVHGSARTDAGVHALGQIAHVDVPERLLGVDWQQALNSMLAPDIAALAVDVVPAGFHSRFDARSKVYAYSLWCNRRYVLPQRRAFVWAVPPLDVRAMDAAAVRLLGEHDFASFRNQGTDLKSTVRTMLAIDRVPDCDPEAFDPAQPELVWHFQATGFLKQMVRNLMGCLVAVGTGRLAPEAVSDILDRRERSLAPATAPARGLTLLRVLY